MRYAFVGSVVEHLKGIPPIQSYENYFSKAGWTADYQCANFAVYKEALEEQGYSVFPEAQRFITKYGGLNVTIPHYVMPITEDNFNTDPLAAIQDEPTESIKELQQNLGISLCPVGQIHGGYMVLLIDTTGRLFKSQGELVYYIGNVHKDALDNLCNGKHIEIKTLQDIPK